MKIQFNNPERCQQMIILITLDEFLYLKLALEKNKNNQHQYDVFI